MASCEPIDPVIAAPAQLQCRVPDWLIAAGQNANVFIHIVFPSIVAVTAKAQCRKCLPSTTLGVIYTAFALHSCGVSSSPGNSGDTGGGFVGSILPGGRAKSARDNLRVAGSSAPSSVVTKRFSASCITTNCGSPFDTILWPKPCALRKLLSILNPFLLLYINHFHLLLL